MWVFVLRLSATGVDGERGGERPGLVGDGRAGGRGPARGAPEAGAGFVPEAEPAANPRPYWSLKPRW